MDVITAIAFWTSVFTWALVVCGIWAAIDHWFERRR